LLDELLLPELGEVLELEPVPLLVSLLLLWLPELVPEPLVPEPLVPVLLLGVELLVVFEPTDVEPVLLDEVFELLPLFQPVPELPEGELIFPPALLPELLLMPELLPWLLSRLALRSRWKALLNPAL
jgi:hypothetical protein